MTVYASIRALRSGHIGTLYPIADHPLHVVCDKAGQVVAPVLRRVIRGESRAFYYLTDDSYIQTRIKDRTLYDKVLSAENLITAGISQDELPEDVSVTLNIGLLNPPKAVADDAYVAFASRVINEWYDNYQYSFDSPTLTLVDWNYQGDGIFKQGRQLGLKTDGALFIDVQFRVGGIYVIRPGQFWKYCKHTPHQGRLTYSTRSAGTDDKFEVFIVSNTDHFRNILKSVKKVTGENGKVTWQLTGKDETVLELGHLGMISSVSSMEVDRDDEGEPIMRLEARVILCSANDELDLHSDHIALVKGVPTDHCFTHSGGDYILLQDGEIDDYMIIAVNHVTEDGEWHLSSEMVMHVDESGTIKGDEVVVKIPCTKLAMYIPLANRM